MFNYQVLQEDIDLIKQSERPTYIRLELLNNNMQVVETLEGNLIDDNFTCDGEAPVRRSYNCTMIVTDSSFQVGKDKKIWVDRYLKVYYGLKVQRTQNIKWYILGVFSFVDISYSYSTTDKTLQLTCSDLMADYDGTKGGIMVYETEAEVTFKVLAGQTFYEVISGLCNSAGIVSYSITGVDGYTIPYDIEWEHGTTYCQAWQELRDLYDFWEFFFDESGMFVWRKVPTGLGEGVVLADDIVKPVVISEQLSDSFQNIYNATEVWGQVLDIVDDDRYTDQCSGGTSELDDTYDITLSLVTSMEDIDNFTNIAIKVSGSYGKYIRINGLEKVPILNTAASALADNTYTANTVYVFRYRRVSSMEGVTLNYYLMGQYQAHGYYEETNVNVPYSIVNLGGKKIVNVIEEESLYSDELCYNQAQYETYKSTAKQDSISLATVIIPFLEPSQKIKYTPLASERTDEWIIKSLSWSTKIGVMSIEMYRFLEDYSYVVRRAQEDN